MYSLHILQKCYALHTSILYKYRMLNWATVLHFISFVQWEKCRFSTAMTMKAGVILKKKMLWKN